MFNWFLDWLIDRPRYVATIITHFVAALITLTITAGLLFGALFIGQQFITAHAAPSTKQQEPAPCVEIAVIGQIHTYQCETLQGQPYLENSMGFMTALGN